MANEQLLLEEKFYLLKKRLDKNLERKHFVDGTIKKQREELREMEVLLEKMHATPIYLSRR